MTTPNHRRGPIEGGEALPGLGKCGAPHEMWEDTRCLLTEGHSERHGGQHRSGRWVEWGEPVPEIEEEPEHEIHAHQGDPESSHAAARREFDIIGGVHTQAEAILVALSDGEWHNSRQLVFAIYGPGPYTYEEAVSLNKIQTVALKLAREKRVERRTRGSRPIEYRRRDDEG